MHGELERARLARSRREEYTALAKVLDALPKRSEFATRQAALEAQLGELAEEGAQLEARRLAHERHCAVLLSAVADLEAALATHDTDVNTSKRGGGEVEHTNNTKKRKASD